MGGYAFNTGAGNAPLTLNPLAEMQQARAQSQQSKLAKLLGAAANGQGDYTQANMIDPTATQAFQKNQSGLQDDKFTSFKQKASMAAAAWKAGNQQLAQGIYASLVPEAHAIAPGFNLPPQMDDSAAQAFEQLSPQQQLSPHVIGSALVGPDGKVLYQGKDKPQNATFQTDAQGRGWWLSPGQAPIPADMPGQAADAQQGPSGGAPAVLNDALTTATDPLAIQSDYKSLAQGFPGTQISSLVRTPEHNAKVGGVPNSQHIRGTAGDFVVPQGEQSAFITQAKARGYEVIPEGDHIHLELPPNRKAPQQVAQGGGIRFPVKGASGGTIPGGPADTGGDYQLSPDAISNSAWDFIMTGTKPQFSRSHEGDKQRIAIQNEVAKIAKQAGVSPSELATQKGKYKALQSSMASLQKQSDVMDKSNETFHRNADLMLSMSAKVPRFDSAVINKYVLDYRMKWTGDPATAAYIAAARTAINEYAKIASGATGGAGSSDTSRREAEEAISAAQSPAQLAAVIKTLKQDAANQTAATHDQLISIGGRMQQFGSTPQQQGDKPANHDPLGIL